MNYAFLVAAHTDACQVHRLAKALLQMGDVYVHIDAKVKDRSIAQSLETLQNTNYTNNYLSIYQHVKVCWGYLQVRWEKLLLQKAIRESEKQYDRIFILSGLDYPIYGYKLP